jgi:hypothetical protein
MGLQLSHQFLVEVSSKSIILTAKIDEFIKMKSIGDIVVDDIKGDVAIDFILVISSVLAVKIIDLCIYLNCIQRKVLSSYLFKTFKRK